MFPRKGTQKSNGPSSTGAFLDTMTPTGPWGPRYQVAVDVPPLHVQNGLLSDAGPTWPWRRMPTFEGDPENPNQLETMFKV